MDKGGQYEKQRKNELRRKGTESPQRLGGADHHDYSVPCGDRGGDILLVKYRGG